LSKVEATAIVRRNVLSEEIDNFQMCLDMESKKPERP
jgi:hypothetical protein